MGGAVVESLGLLAEAIVDGNHPIKAKASTFAAESLTNPGRDDFDFDRWKLAADFGIQGMMIPSQYGGQGATAVEGALTFEGLGLGCADNGFLFALSSQSFAMQRALITAGTEGQRLRWLPRLADGSARGSFAMSEPEAGSDTAAISTTATLLDGSSDGSTFRLDGTKAWVTLAPVAEVVVVFATTDANKGHWGITAFIIETTRPGITVGPVQQKMGLNSCPFGTLTFSDCRVGPEDMLGNPGSGGAIFTGAVEAERAFLYAAQMGSMERVLNLTIERARSRSASGQPIGAFQAIGHRIADMKLRHESARLLILKAAALYDQGASMTMAGAMAKLQTSEMAVQSAIDSMRIHGAAGYTTELGIEAEVRDALGGLSYSGTSEIARNLIARMLRVDRPLRRRPNDGAMR